MKAPFSKSGKELRRSRKNLSRRLDEQQLRLKQSRRLQIVQSSRAGHIRGGHSFH